MNNLDGAEIPSWLSVEITTADHATWITLVGAAETSNLEHLQDALGDIALDGTREVHLCLSELHFCDVRALRQLFVLAVEVRRTGREVVVHDASHTIRKMIRLIDVDEVLRLG